MCLAISHQTISIRQIVHNSQVNAAHKSTIVILLYASCEIVWLISEMTKAPSINHKPTSQVDTPVSRHLVRKKLVPIRWVWHDTVAWITAGLFLPPCYNLSSWGVLKLHVSHLVLHLLFCQELDRN